MYPYLLYKYIYKYYVYYAHLYIYFVFVIYTFDYFAHRPRFGSPGTRTFPASSSGVNYECTPHSISAHIFFTHKCVYKYIYVYTYIYIYYV